MPNQLLREEQLIKILVPQRAHKSTLIQQLMSTMSCIIVFKINVSKNLSENNILMTPFVTLDHPGGRTCVGARRS